MCQYCQQHSEGKEWNLKANPSVIRKAVAEDCAFLKEMLYKSTHIPPGYDKPPPSIIELPELCFAVQQKHRNRGLGTALMEVLLGELKEKGYKKYSLKGSKTNRVVRLYRWLRFELFKEQQNDFLLVKTIKTE